jgi:hypothetical protein
VSYWEDYCPNPFDDYEDEEVEVTCKYCGQPDLEWVQLPAGWRLFDSDGNLHKCSRRDDPAKIFSASPLDKS